MLLIDHLRSTGVDVRVDGRDTGSRDRHVEDGVDVKRRVDDSPPLDDEVVF